MGVIPDEWEVKLLGDLFGFSGGYSASRDQLSMEGHCYLHYGDIHGSTKTFVDTRVDYQDIPKLDIPLKRVSPRSLLADGDVVFVDASEDHEGASKHVVVVNKDDVPFISGLHTIVAKSKTDELVHEYRRYCFQTAAVRQQFVFYAVGTKVVGISKSNIPKLFLPVPATREQRVIATALSGVDALLGGLDRLVAKKRDLKQAAMQQLLTGQTRLPGFHAEWKSKKFSDLLRYERPEKWLVKSTDYEQGGDTPVLTANKSFILGHTNERFGVYEEPPVIIFDDFTTDSKYVEFPFKVKSSAIKILRSRSSDVNLRFVAERMRLVRFPVGEHKRYYISEYQHVELPTPDPDEQCAIDAALFDMAAELAALEARRDKTRDLKHAMIQELLTGKTRLVHSEAAYA